MTNKLAISFSLAAVATLAACGTPGGNHETVVVGSADPAYVASAQAVPIGSGVIAGSAKVTYLVDPAGPIADISAQRVIVRMKGGATQGLYVKGEQLTLGEEIVIRSDNSIKREPKN
jgi:hypothetical protein